MSSESMFCAIRPPGIELKYSASYVQEFKHPDGGVKIVVCGIVAVEVMDSVDRHGTQSWPCSKCRRLNGLPDEKK